MPDPVPIRDRMMPEAWYAQIDRGVRFAVRVLHAAGGMETCQSCEGGAGHAYSEPSIDLVAEGGHDATGFRALAALTAYGLDVHDVAIIWTCQHGLPYQRIWRVTLRATYPERADEIPGFIYGCRATGGEAP
jgi:hypothetical protein